MKYHTISVFEHQSIKVGELGFTEDHRKSLECFLGNNDESTFPYYTLIHNGVKFRQYVGVLSINDLTIEILPKTDKDTKSKDYWRDKLILMLSKIYRLEIRSFSDANQNTKTNSKVLDVIIARFLDEIDKIFNRGLVKCYHKNEDNLKLLKGKLNIGKQLKLNSIHKERFYMQYNTYDYEHVMNRILRQTLVLITKTTRNITLNSKASSLLFNFPELTDLLITHELFDNLHFDRKTADYKTSIKIAKLLLLNHVPNRVNNQDKIIALMFDINKLWEEYVYITIKQQHPNYNIHPQIVKPFWQKKDSLRIKNIKPDIVIKKNDEVIAILDTKWKCIDDTPSDSDLHQMFVYSKLFKTDKVFLIYPSIDEKKSTIEAYFLDTLNNRTSCNITFLELNNLN